MGVKAMRPDLELYMPVAGKVIPLEDVNGLLAEDMVGGMGAGIIPSGDIFYSPVSGKVVMVAENLNSVAIATQSGITILIHAGIDTAKLGGRGFCVYVREGDSVTAGDKLLYMDREYVESRAKITTPLIITTPEMVGNVETYYYVNDAFVKFMEIFLAKD